MQVAREIQKDGIKRGGVTHYPRIRFMGLYDPVDLAARFSDSDKIAPNVDNVEAVFPDTGKHTPPPPPPKFGPGLPPARGTDEFPLSRAYFRRVGKQAEDPKKTNYHITQVTGTHGGIGGAPFAGDRPGGSHTKSTDTDAAMAADRAIRAAAKKAGVPIDDVVDYGYVRD